MERRELVNASNEYDSGVWGVSTTPPASPSRSPRFAKTSPSSAPGGQNEWAFSPPDIAPISPVATPQFPSSQPPSASTRLRLGASQPAVRPLCLYFGPAGERCYRPALDNGFCPRHQPNASPTALRDEARARRKKAATTVGIVAALWPFIEELLRQIFRLLR